MRGLLKLMVVGCLALGLAGSVQRNKDRAASGADSASVLCCKMQECRKN